MTDEELIDAVARAELNAARAADRYPNDIPSDIALRHEAVIKLEMARKAAQKRGLL